MRLDRRDPYALLLFFSALAFLSFRVYFQNTGFYLDDWAILEKTMRAGGLFPAIGLFWDGHHLGRPLSAVLIPLIYSLVGKNIWAGQLLLFALEVCETFALYLFVRRLTQNRDAALVAATAALIVPIRSIMHPWLATATIHISLALSLTGLWAYHVGIDEDKRAWRFGGLAAYFAACLVYESVLFFPLALAGGRFGRMRASGLAPVKAAKVALREIAPFGVLMAAVVFWQRFAVGALFGVPAKSASFSIGHAFDVYASAVRCLSDELASFLLLTAKDFFGRSGAAPILLWAVVTAGAVWFLRAARSKDAADHRTVSALLGAAAALFVGGYAPYALSGNYAPTIVMQASRHNNAGAIVAGLLAAAAAASMRPDRAAKVPRLRKAAGIAGVFFLIGACTWANLQMSRQWALSWRLQLRILADTHARLRNVRPPATVLLANAPKVFNFHFDFDSALRLSTRRKDRDKLTGALVTPRLRFKEKTVEDVWKGETTRTYDYSNLFLFDYKEGSFRRLKGPPSAANAQAPAGDR